MRKGKGILAGIIYPSAWYRGKKGWGWLRESVGTPRFSRSVTAQAAPRPIRRVVVRERMRKSIYVSSCISSCRMHRNSCRSQFFSHPVISDCQWSPLPLARSRSIGLHASEIGNQLSALIFWSWRGRNSGGSVVS